MGFDSHLFRSDMTATLACSLLIPTSTKRHFFFLKIGPEKLKIKE